MQLVVGLGNPGKKYESTRHNAGFWFADALAKNYQGTFKRDTQLNVEVCKLSISGHELWVIKPQTFMNLSGDAAQKIMHFYRIPVEAVLVAHDELDLPVGTVRFKNGGGHGGHNGLRDLTAKIGKEFWRLRIGVGHPGHKDLVHDYVLNRPSADDEALIRTAINSSLQVMELVVAGHMDRAMNKLHSN